MSTEQLANYIINDEHFSMQVWKPHEAYRMQTELADDGIRASIGAIRAACAIRQSKTRT